MADKNLGFFDRLLLEQNKKPRSKTISPAVPKVTNITSTPTTPSTTLASPRVQNARSQYYNQSPAKTTPRGDENKETPTEVSTHAQTENEQPVEQKEVTHSDAEQGHEVPQPTEHKEVEQPVIVPTSSIIAKFQELDKKAAESVPPPLRQSDDKAFTVKPIRDDPIVSPNRIAPKMTTTSGDTGIIRPQRSSNSVRTTNQEWRGSLFDRLMTPDAISPKPTNTTPRDMNEQPVASPLKKRTIDFANKVSRLKFSPDVIKHFEQLTAEDAASLDFNYFVFTYDFENNKKNEVVFVDKGRGVEALREKLDPSTIFHAIYRVELVVGNDLPNFVKYFLLTWTGEQVSNIKRAHATSNISVIEQFFECAFATVHITNTGPEVQEDLERALSNVHHIQTLW